MEVRLTESADGIRYREMMKIFEFAAKRMNQIEQILFQFPSLMEFGKKPDKCV